jgi:putative acetyltransferase
MLLMTTPPVGVVRSEEPRDHVAVHRLLQAAFGSPAEANLVETLRGAGAVTLALVAELDTEIIGHIVFSPVGLESAPARKLIGLGPMAVAPTFQRLGIGASLVRAGLERCQAAGADAVVVVGHANYHPRFGFLPAHRFGLRSEYDVPADVFMAVELVPNSLRHASGLVRYHRAFSEC